MGQREHQKIINGTLRIMGAQRTERGGGGEEELHQQKKAKWGPTFGVEPSQKIRTTPPICAAGSTAKDFTNNHGNSWKNVTTC
jgi:hypothetical protein